MRRFFGDARGAVTVFVTLLLVPALLVSGTAVDLARMHTARSVLQDANQLAANSVLTQYNALLYDLYGVMGVAKDDPVFAELLDSYIKVAVFGEKEPDKTVGTLQLFYGADISMEEPFFPEGKDLGKADVLRRQIEEYMKFRAPVIIVKEFLDAFEGNKIKEDTKIIDDKLEIESDIADVYEKYKELYEAINTADLCNQIRGIAGGSFAAVSSTLKTIRDQFVDLKACYTSWQNASDDDDEEGDSKKAEYSEKYDGILENIKSYTTGGSTRLEWRNGRWTRTGSSQGINTTIENAKRQGDDYKPNFDSVVSISREIDRLHSEISRKVDELERKLEKKECSEDMQKALTDKTGNPEKSMIERYRDILKWDNLAAMATTFKDGGYSYIDNEYKPMLDGVEYRNVNNLSAGRLSREQLGGLPSDSRFNLSENVSAARSRAAVFAAFSAESVTYKMPPGFLKYAEHSEKNRSFYNELATMMSNTDKPPVKLYEGQGDESGKDSEEKQENIIKAVLKIVDDAYNGLTNNPLGAKSIEDSETPDAKKPGILDIVETIKEATGGDFVNTFSDPLGSLAKTGDYILLLTYCTSMFSNYTTTKPESVGKTREELDKIKFTKSITGVPIKPKVNYFFQSEWEYLYEGNKDAGANLSAVTNLIFTVRLICNYIKVFSISEITMIVTSIQAAFALAPPVGIILGELARAAFVAAETLIDVASLRSGHKVPLLKSVNEWVCSVSGIIEAVSNTASEAGSGENAKKSEKGLTYSQYMLFFFITKAIFGMSADKASEELALRTGELIEWNMINYLKGVNADESKMAEVVDADDRFRLSDMKTDFSITTSVKMRMLFLSLPFARDFSDTRGIGMPTAIPISVTDYRGY